MAIHNAIEAVIKALQRQQSEAAGGAPPRAEPINEVMRGSLQNSPMHSVRIENPSQLTGTKDGRVKARVLD